MNLIEKYKKIVGIHHMACALIVSKASDQFIHDSIFSADIYGAMIDMGYNITTFRDTYLDEAGYIVSQIGDIAEDAEKALAAIYDAEKLHR